MGRVPTIYATVGYYPYFKDEKIEAQRSELTYLKSWICKMLHVAVSSGSSDPQIQTFYISCIIVP